MSDLFGGLPDSVSLERQVEAVRRELSMRRRVYPRWVENGKMTERQAAEEISVMEAVLLTLANVQALQRRKESAA